jgi:uncharacterized protein with PIN domain
VNHVRTIRFLLDEDVSPEVAVVARGLGLDAVSVHEIARTGLSDEDQLVYAANQQRVLVTRNRDDFIALTRSFYATNRTHHGVLVFPRTLPNNKPAAMAHAISAWLDRNGEHDPGLGFLEFL